jgi:hypothetical protein
MSLSKRTLLTAGAAAAIAVAVGASSLAVAQFQNSPLMKSNTDSWSSQAEAGLADLGENEGLFVAKSTFKVVRGKAKTDPATQLVKMGAREVSHGAIILRSGGKLYIVDGTPPAGGSPQAMKDFASEVWSQPRLMKGFDDNFSPLMR